MSRIFAHDAALFKKWGWNPPRQRGDFPFGDQPPLTNPQRLARFFAGRDDEVRRAVRALYYGQNVLVRGTWGIGKTAFILSVLHALQGEARAQGVSLLATYAHEFNDRDASLDGFYRAVLYSLARAMTEMGDDVAIRILQDLAGIEVTRGRKKKATLSGKVGIASLGELSGAVETGAEDTQALQVTKNAKHHIDTLLGRAQRDNIRVVVALDDMDKVKDYGAVRQMLVDGKALLRNAPCNFILTGRAMVAAWEDFSPLVLELFRGPVHLGRLPEEALHRAAVGQLNTIRKSASDGIHPFEEDALRDAIGLSRGFPRLFNKLCWSALQYALEMGTDRITCEMFRASFDRLKGDVSVNVPLEVRRLLYRLAQKGRLALGRGAEVEELLREQGVDRVYELVAQFHQYIQKDWILAEEEQGRLVFSVSPLAAGAAEEGKSE